MVILNISEVLPAPIKDKERENDIHLVTAQQHFLLYPDSKHLFVLTIPFVSKMVSLFSNKWNSYRRLRKARTYAIANHKVDVLALFMRGYRFTLLRPVLDWLSYQCLKKRLSHLVVTHNVSIIHAHNVHHIAYLASRLAKDFNIPYIITSRKIHTYRKSKRTQELLKKADAVICINPHHKKLVDEIIPRHNSYLLPHGIDIPTVIPISLSTGTGHPVKIVSICNLIPRKNIDKVLYALDQLDAPFVYDIYGDGPELEHLKHILSSLSIKNKVTLKGRIQHETVVHQLMTYDLFVLPSENETFGRVYIEAMSAGLAIIASKHTGIDGYITNGLNGFLVDPKNSSELTDTLAMLIADPTLREKIGNQAKVLSKDFYWKNIITKLQLIYDSVSIKK